MRTFLFLFCSLPLHAADWPQWMGPNRDGVWAEDGILDTFPPGGPKKLWSKPIAGGYSGPSVADGRVFVMDYLRTEGDERPDPGTRNGLGGSERIHCFDLESGESKWTHTYNCPYLVSYPAGPRCTPTVYEGRVYALGTMGNLTCLDAVSGEKHWQHDLPKKFDAKVPMWGYAGHPLVYKNLLICLVGGADALVVAFDKTSGDVKWKALATPEDGAGYCPPSIIEAGGVTQLILWHPQAVVSLDPETGKTHWQEKLAPSYGMSIMMPRQGGNLLYAGGIGNAGLALKLGTSSPTATVAWQGGKHTAIYPANSTPLIDGDTLYGVDVQGYLRAAKLSTGERLWETTLPVVNAAQKPTPHGTAFITRYKDKYFLFNEKGDLVIAKLSPKECEVVSQAHLIAPTTPAFNRTVVWSHPAYAKKCIVARNDTEIVCYSLAKD